MIRAVVQVTKYTQQGWDSYKDTYEETFEGPTKQAAESKAEAYVRYLNNTEHKGDFNITLGSYDAKIIRFESVEILNEI